MGLVLALPIDLLIGSGGGGGLVFARYTTAPVVAFGLLGATACLIERRRSPGVVQNRLADLPAARCGYRRARDLPRALGREPRQLGPAGGRRHSRKAPGDHLRQSVGASTGKTPDTIQMAKDAFTFIRALGFDQVDLHGFSMGGMIAQVVAQDEPELVRKLILTGTGPAGGKGIKAVVWAAQVDTLRGLLSL
jgi:hypothetical protein